MTDDGRMPESAAERLLLDEAAALVSSPRHPAALDVEPVTAALLAARATDGTCRAWNDSWRGEAAMRADAAAGVSVHAAYGGALLDGADVVLMRLPSSLDALAERAAAVAHLAGPDVTLLVGARIKDLTRSMTTVLERHFGTVRGSLGRQKARVLVATDPRPGPIVEPVRRHHDDLDLTVVAHGGVFAGAGVDLGTRTLLHALERTGVGPEQIGRIADLGCGTGILAAVAARSFPDASVVAVDDSAVACWSAAATAAANDAERVDVRRQDGLTDVMDGSLDLVLCNPPFHRGVAKDSTDAFAMITDAARTLRAGGELWTVYNAHLPYLPTLQRMVGPTRIAARTKSFLVTCSERR